MLISTWQRRSSSEDRNAKAMIDGGDDFTIWHLIDTALPILLWIEAHRLWTKAAPPRHP